MASESEELVGCLGKAVVVDTNGTLIYIGTLARWGDHFVELRDADVHDLSRGLSTRDAYALAALKHGVQKNRRSVLIRKEAIRSLSPLEDVIDF